MFEYRLLPVPTAAKKVKGLKTAAERFAHTMAEALNHEAKSGWEFVRQESFHVEEKAGMMGKVKEARITYLVFRREVAGETVPLDVKLQQMQAKRAMAATAAPAAAAVAAPVFDEPTVVAPTPPQAAQQPLSATQEPFPEPMLSPQAMEDHVGPYSTGTAQTNPGFADELGQKPARIFEPLQTNDTGPGDAPNLGPASKD